VPNEKKTLIGEITGLYVSW